MRPWTAASRRASPPFAGRRVAPSVALARGRRGVLPRRAPAQVRLAGGADLVQAADGRLVGGLVQDVRRLPRLPGDGQHGGGEAVERLARFRLRRLDHDRLGDDQGEVDRRRVVAVVDQALGQVEGAQAVLAQPAPVQDELVHADAVDVEGVDVPQRARAGSWR